MTGSMQHSLQHLLPALSQVAKVNRQSRIQNFIKNNRFEYDFNSTYAKALFFLSCANK